MAKVECYTPDGEMRMKEPVDARECVKNLGFTMDAPCDDKSVDDSKVDGMDEKKSKSTKKKKSK